MAESFWIGWKTERERSRRTRKQQGTDAKWLSERKKISKREHIILEGKFKVVSRKEVNDANEFPSENLR